MCCASGVVTSARVTPLTWHYALLRHGLFQVPEVLNASKPSDLRAPLLLGKAETAALSRQVMRLCLPIAGNPDVFVTPPKVWMWLTEPHLCQLGAVLVCNSPLQPLCCSRAGSVRGNKRD